MTDRPHRLPPRSQQPRRRLPRAGQADHEERPSRQRGASLLGLNRYRHIPELRDAPGYPSLRAHSVPDLGFHTMIHTQISLDAEQTAKLDKLAATNRTTRSTVIRRAVDAYIAQACSTPSRGCRTTTSAVQTPSDSRNWSDEHRHRDDRPNRSLAKICARPLLTYEPTSSASCRSTAGRG